MKPNFKTMSKGELRAYVLEHREDREALRALMSRRDPHGIKYNFPSRTSSTFKRSRNAI